MTGPAPATPGAAPDADESRQYPYWRGNLRAVPLVNLLGAFAFSITFPFLPLIVRGLGVQENLETWIGNMMLAFYLVGFVINPIWGGIADHYGRKIMVLRATLGMGVTMAVVPFATSPLAFACLFVLVGFCNGFVPASMALLAANTPPGRLGRALSLAQSGALVGHTMGPALGAVLAVLVGNPLWLFWASAVLLLAGGILAACCVHEVKQLAPGPWRPEWIGSLREFVALPRVGVLYFLSLVFAMLWHGSVPVIAIYMLNLVEARALGDEAFWVGASALGLGVASIVALPFWGRTLDRFGPSGVLTVGVAGAVVTHLPLLVLETPVELVLSRVAFGLCGSAIQPAIVQLIRIHAPKGMDARAMAYASSFQFLAMGLAPFIAGLVGPVLGLRAYFALNIAITAIGLVLWLRRR